MGLVITDGYITISHGLFVSLNLVISPHTKPHTATILRISPCENFSESPQRNGERKKGSWDIALIQFNAPLALHSYLFTHRSLIPLLYLISSLSSIKRAISSLHKIPKQYLLIYFSWLLLIGKFPGGVLFMCCFVVFLLLDCWHQSVNFMEFS